MKEQLKKFGAWLMAAALAFAGASAYADPVVRVISADGQTTTDYSGFYEASQSLSGGETVQLQSDINEGLYVKTDLTLDLNGHKLTGGEQYYKAGTTKKPYPYYSALTIEGGKTVTIKDSSSGKGGQILSPTAEKDIDYDRIICVRGANVTLNIEGGTFINENMARPIVEIYEENLWDDDINLNVNISGGKFVSELGSAISCGEGDNAGLVFVTGGDFTAVTGLLAVKDAAYKTYADVLIAGGTYKAAEKLALEQDGVLVRDYDDQELGIGFDYVVDSEDNFTQTCYVRALNYVATVDATNKHYESLKDAIDAAADAGTVSLIKDCGADEPFEFSKGVTIDFKGFAYAGSFVAKEGAVVLKNGTVNGLIENKGATLTIAANTTLAGETALKVTGGAATLDGGAITGGIVLNGGNLHFASGTAYTGTMDAANIGEGAITKVADFSAKEADGYYWKENTTMKFIAAKCEDTPFDTIADAIYAADIYLDKVTVTVKDPENPPPLTDFYCYKPNQTGAAWKLDYNYAYVFGEAGGSGTLESPYEIPDVETLKAFRDLVNLGCTFAGKFVKVTAATLNLNNEEWTPIGDKERTDCGGGPTKYFKGSFDGNGVVIKNLKITSDTWGGNYTAFFSAIGDANASPSAAVIKNFTIQGSVDGLDVAGVVARVDGATVENVTSEVTVNGSKKAGGICCLAQLDANFTGCVNKGAVTMSGTAANRPAAGIVALSNTPRLTFTDCVNEGTIVCAGSSSYAAGITGYEQSTAENCWHKYIRCVNKGTISVTGSKGLACGLVGKFGMGEHVSRLRLYVQDCANYGTLNSTGSTYAIASMADPCNTEYGGYFDGEIKAFSLTGTMIALEGQTFLNQGFQDPLCGNWCGATCATTDATYGAINIAYAQLGDALTAAKKGETVQLKRNDAGTYPLAYGVSVAESASKPTAKFTGTFTAPATSQGEWDVVNENGTYKLVHKRGPFNIPDLVSLECFCDMAKAGETFAGETVNLTAALDLTGIAWEPIKDFGGTFDGNGNTISNLKCVMPDKSNLGLFGNLKIGATIKGVNVNNVTIEGNDTIGTIVGTGPNGSTLIEDCHVTGTINLKAKKRVGGIVGGYYVTVKNCSVDGTSADTSVLEAVAKQTTVVADVDGHTAGGIIGFQAEGNMEISGCSVKNVTVKGAERIGGISGYAFGNHILNCSVENVKVEKVVTTSAIDNWDSVALIAGGDAGGSGEHCARLIGCTTNNCTFINKGTEEAAKVIGTSDNDGKSVVDKPYRALVGPEAEFVSKGSTKIISGKFTQFPVNNDANLIAEGSVKYIDPADANLTVVAAGLTPDTDGKYHIANMADLNVFRTMVNAGNEFANATVVLDDNITFVGVWDSGIGHSYQGKCFKGTFDGQNKTITGLKINDSGSWVGFFGYCDGTATKIKDLTLADVEIVGNTYVGAIIGSIGAQIDNCVVSGGSVKGIEQVGGVIGFMSLGDVNGVLVTNLNVEATADCRAGGIAGKVQPDGHFSITGCSLVDVTVKASEKSGTCCAAGLAAQLMCGPVHTPAHYGIYNNTLKNVKTITAGDSAFVPIGNFRKETDYYDPNATAKIYHNHWDPEITPNDWYDMVNPNDQSEQPAYVRIYNYSAIYNTTLGKGYTDLGEAVDAASDGDVIVFNESCAGKGVFVGPEKFKTNGLTIDFNGCTYTVNTAVGSPSTPNQAFHFEKGNKITLTDGTLTVDETKKSDFKFVIQNYADLTLNNMNVDGTNLGKANVNYALSVNNGSTKLTGTTTITAVGNNVAMDVYDYKSGNYTGVKVEIVDTTVAINGKISLGGSDSNYADATLTAPAGYTVPTAPQGYTWLSYNGQQVLAKALPQVEGVYQIGTADQMVTFDMMLADATYAAADYALTADIDMSRVVGWVPRAFNGKFDGAGCTVANLKVEGANKVGLFGSTGDGAVVRKVTLDNAYVKGTGSEVGALIGGGFKTRVENVHVINSTVIGGGQYTGGIVGGAYTTVVDSEVAGCTIKGFDQVGGVIGYICGASITGTIATNNMVEATSERAGALAGKINVGDTNILKFNDNVVSGTVTAPDMAGGICAQLMGKIASYEIMGNLIDVSLVAPEKNPIGVLREKQSATFTGVLAKNITGNWWTDATYNENSYTYDGTSYDPVFENQTIYRGVAKVGETPYPTVEEAVADANGGTVKIIGDFTLRNTYEVDGQFGAIFIDRAVTLDLDGKTITVTAPQKNNVEANAIVVMNAETGEQFEVTIKNGNVLTTAGAGGIMVRDYAKVMLEGLNVTESGYNVNDHETNYRYAAVTAGGDWENGCPGQVVILDGTYTGDFKAVMMKRDASVIISNGTFACTQAFDAQATDAYESDKLAHAICNDYGYLEIDDGTFNGKTGDENAVAVWSSDLYGQYVSQINGGTFNGAVMELYPETGVGMKITDGEFNGTIYPLTGGHCGHYQISGPATFIDNLTNKTIAANTTFGEGWTPVKVSEDPERWSVASVAFKVGDQYFGTMAEAAAVCAAGGTIEILRPSTNANGYAMANLPNNVTVKGLVDGIVFNCVGSGSIASIPHGATFENVTMYFGANDYHGFQHAGHIVMNGCTLNGKFFSYGDMTFNECTFNAPGTSESGVSSKDYSMWAYSGNLDYHNCTFNMAGKGINVFNEGLSLFDITFDHCVFNSTVSNKSAVNVKGTVKNNDGTPKAPLHFNVVLEECKTETPTMFPSTNRLGDPLVMIDDYDSDYVKIAKAETNALGVLVVTDLYKRLEPVDGVYAIGTMDDLNLFREMANGSDRFTTVETFAGKTVIMTNDIVFQDAAWDSGIGKNVDKGKFQGTFDGAGHKITGLKIAGNHNNMALFDAVWLNTIKNLTLVDVNISNSRTAEEPLNSSGNPEPANNYTGAIVGSGAVTIENCAVLGGTIEGSDQVGAIDGYLNSSTVQNCLVSNVTVHAKYRAGGIAGKANVDSEYYVIGNTVVDSTIISDSYRETQPMLRCAAILVGQVMTGANNTWIISDNVSSNVTTRTGDDTTLVPISEFRDGHFRADAVSADHFVRNNWAGYGENADKIYYDMYKPGSDTEYVRIYNFVAAAKLGDTYYNTLAEAYGRANAGDTITLVRDVNNAGLVIDKSVTIDLGGFTYTVDRDLVGSANTKNQAFQILKEAGNVTISNGTLTATATGARFVIQNYANLTLDKVVVDGAALNNEKTCYALSNNNGETHLKNSTTITAPEGGVAFDVYDYASQHYTGVSVTIDDDSVTVSGPVEFGGDRVGGNDSKLTVPFGYGAEHLDTPVGFVWVTDESGTTEHLQAGVAKIVGDPDTYYATLKEAFNAVVEGDTVEIVQSVDNIDEVYTISANNVTVKGVGDITLTGKGESGNNGFTVTGSGVKFQDIKLVNFYNMLDGAYKSTIFVKGSGEFTFNATNVMIVGNRDIYIAGNFAEGSAITIDDCDLTGVYTINTGSVSGNAALNVKDTGLHGWTSYAVVSPVTFTNCTIDGEGSSYAVLCAYSDTTFNGCTFKLGDTTGYNGLYVKKSGANITFDNNCTYTINGGEVTPLTAATYGNILCQKAEGGTVDAVNQVLAKVGDAPVKHTTGPQDVDITYTQDPTAWLVDGYRAVDNHDGTYSVTSIYWDAHAAEAYAAGAKDEANKTLTIASAAELALFAKEINQGLYNYNLSGGNVWTIYINGEIDLGEGDYYWTPIDNYNGAKTAKFVIEGINGGTIKNMKIRSWCGSTNDEGTHYCSGFFGQTAQKLTIRNLAFDNANIAIEVNGKTEDCNQVAVVVGMTYSDVLIEGVSIANSTIKGCSKVAAFVGSTGGDGEDIMLSRCELVNTKVHGVYSYAMMIGWENAYNGVNDPISIVECRAYGDCEVIRTPSADCPPENDKTVVDSYGTNCVHNADDGKLWLVDPANAWAAGDIYENGQLKKVTIDDVEYTLKGGAHIRPTFTGADGWQYSEEPQADIDGFYYWTLAEAVEAAEAGQTVNLRKDCSGEGIVIDESITLNLGGKTYTAAANLVDGEVDSGIAFQVAAGAVESPVVISNGTLTAANAATLLTTAAGAKLVLSEGLKLVNAGEGKVALDVNAAEVLVDSMNVTVDGTVTFGGEGASLTVPAAYTGITVPNYTWTLPKDGYKTLVPAVWELTNPEADSVTYGSLDEAIQMAGEGAVIKLLVDVTTGGVSVPSGKNFTLDFNGMTYAMECPGAGSAGTKTCGFQLLEGSTITFKNGTIKCTDANKDAHWNSDSTSKGIAMLIQNYANLTLEGMTVDGTNIAHNDPAVTRYVISNNAGSLTLDNSVVIAAEGDFAFDTCKFKSYDAPTVTVTGENSSITGKVEVSGGALALNEGELVGDLKISSIGEDRLVTKAVGFDAPAPEGYRWSLKYGRHELVPYLEVAEVTKPGTEPQRYADLAKAFSEHLNDKDVTVTLINDVDLIGVDWQSVYGFVGTFDGDNHTISNLSVSNNTIAYVGFFGYNANGDLRIKDVTFDHATVMGDRGAVVLGATYHASIDNVKVLNSTVIGAQKFGGLVGFPLEGGTLKVTNCAVENLALKGNLVVMKGDPSAVMAGGLIGWIHYGESIEITGNTVKSISFDNGFMSKEDMAKAIASNPKLGQYAYHSFIGTVIGTTPGNPANSQVILANNTVVPPVQDLPKTQNTNEYIGWYYLEEWRTDGQKPVPIYVDGVCMENRIIAKIGTTNYYSLTNAIAHAEANDTIVLQCNNFENGYPKAEGIEIPSGKSFTLDFGGKTFTFDDEVAGFGVASDSTVTFQNGTFTNANENGIALVNAGVLTVGEDMNVAGDIALDGGSMTLNAGTLAGDIELNGGNLALNAGTLTGALVAGENIANGSVTKAAAFVAANIPAEWYWKNNTKLTLCAARIKVGDEYAYYPTLADAIANVQNDETIEIVKDVTDAVGIAIDTGKTFTIDFGGHTYTVSKPGAGSTGTKTLAFQLIKGQTVTFQNGTINAAEDNLEPAVSPAKNIKRFFQNYANLTLKDMIIDGTYLYGTKGVDPLYSVCEFENGTVSIEGNTSITAKEGADAITVCTYGKAPYADGTQVKIDTTGSIGSISVLKEYDSDNFENSSLELVKGTIAELKVDGSDAYVVTKTDDVVLPPPVPYGWKNGQLVRGVVKIGTDYYATLDDAFKAVSADNTMIELITNVTDAVGISVDTKHTGVTVDFKGFTYTVSLPGAGSTGTKTLAFQLLKGQGLTFKGGTIKVGEDNLVESTDSDRKNIKRIFQSYANLTLTDMTIDGTNVYGNNSVCEFANGTVALTGATSIKAHDGAYAVTVDNWKGAYPDGVAVSVETTGTIDGIHCYTEGEGDSTPATVALNSGTITEIFVEEGNDDAYTIGNYGATVTKIPDDYKWVDIATGGQVLVHKDYICQLNGGQRYETLAAAFAAVTSPADTVSMISNAVVAQVVSNAVGTLDFAGYTISSTEKGAALHFAGATALTLTNSTDAVGGVAGNLLGLQIEVGDVDASLTIAGGKMSGSRASLDIKKERVKVTGKCSVFVSGGFFEGALSDAASSLVKHITGGFYTIKPTEGYQADEYQIRDVVRTPYLYEVCYDWYAKVYEGDTFVGEYKTLADAIAAATDGQTVYMLKDVADIGNIYLPAGVTLDGKGTNDHGETKVCTITGDSSIWVNAQGGTVKNVNFADIHYTDVGTTDRSAIYGKKLANGATLTVENCSFDSCGWDAVQVTPEAGATVNINNNVFKTSKPDECTLAHRYIHVESDKKVKPTDFTITATGNKFYNCNVLNQTGFEVYFPADPEKVNLTHNFMDAPMAVCIGTGDSYNNASYLVNPMVTEDLATEVNVVAQFDDNGNKRLFLSLEEAIAAAPENATVQLLNPVTFTADYELVKAITLDLNGNNVQFADVALSANLTIIDSKDSALLTPNGTIAVAAGKTINLNTLGYDSKGLAKGATGSLRLAAGANATLMSAWNEIPVNFLIANNPNFIVPEVDSTVTLNNKLYKWDGEKFVTGNEVALTAMEIVNGGKKVAFQQAFDSLADAVNAATNGATVTMLKDHACPAYVVIDKELTLDLNGKAVSYGGTSMINTGVIAVKHGGTLTVKDSATGGVIDGSNAYAGIAMTAKDGDTDAAQTATLVVESGTIQGYYYGIVGNGNRGNTSVTIDGGTIKGLSTEETIAECSYAIYNPQPNSTVTINGGTLEGMSGIEMRAGELVVYGGTITAKSTQFAINANGDGTTTLGAALAISQHTTQKDIAVEISGGTFTGVYALNESNPQENDPAPTVTMSVTGGTFDGKVAVVDAVKFVEDGLFKEQVRDAYCVAGKVPTHTKTVDDKWFTVVDGEFVALNVTKDPQIGYTTLAEAVSAASAGDTIELCLDIADAGELTLPANVTIKGNGKTLSGNSAFKADEEGATIENVKFANIHNAKGELSPIYGKSLAGTLTVKDCSFDTCDWDAIQVTPLAGSEVVINGNTFKTTYADSAKRYIHVESEKSVDFTITATGNKFYDCQKLTETCLEVYYPTVTDKVTLRGNFVDAPIAVCIGIGNSFNNASYLINPMVAEDGVTPVTVVAQYDDDGNKKLFTNLVEAINAVVADTTVENKTVQLVADTTLPSSLDKSVVLDLNGWTLTVDSVNLAANLKVTDTTDPKTGKLVVNGVVAVGENSSLDIHDLGYGDIGLIKDKNGTLTIAAGGNVVVPQQFDGFPVNYLKADGPFITDLATGATVTLNGTTYTWDGTMFLDNENNVAITKTTYLGKTFDQGYNTLSEAVAAANAGATVTMLKDYACPAYVVIDKELTLDLNGKAVSYGGASMINTGVIAVKHGGTLTVKDSATGGVIDGSNAYAGIAMTAKDGDTDAALPATLVVESGTIQGYYYGICGNGNRGNTSVTINGGTIKGLNTTETVDECSYAIYNPQPNSTVTINGGKLEGMSGIEMRAGELVVNGGTITAKSTQFAIDANGDGTTTLGAALAISQHTTKQNIAVTITNGTFTGVYALNESNPQENEPAPTVTMSVTGGTFDGKVAVVDAIKFVEDGLFKEQVKDAYCVAGKVPTHTKTVDDKWFTVVNGSFVAHIGEVGYETLIEAAAAAKAGETVTLDCDIADAGEVLLTAGATIDGAGKVLSSNTCIKVAAEGGTVKNCVFDTCAAEAIVATPVEGATVTIVGNTFKTTNADAATTYVAVTSEPNVDYAVAVTNNSFLNCAKLEGAGLKVYSPANASSMDVSHNYMDAPMAIRVGAGELQNNASERFNPMVDAEGTEVWAAAEVMDENGNNWLFTTLEDALASAKITGSQTPVKVLLDTTIDSVMIGSTVVLDTNGKTITLEGDDVIDVGADGNLTLVGDGKVVNATQDADAILVTDTTASLTINGATVEGGYAGVWASAGNFELVSGEVKGYVALDIGDTDEGEPVSVTISGGKVTAMDDGLAVYVGNLNITEGFEFAIEGGQFYGDIQVQLAWDIYGTISGGLFTMEPDSYWCKEGYIVTDSGDTVYPFMVKQGDPLPVIPDAELTDAKVAEVLAGAADGLVKANVNKSNYKDFQQWAHSLVGKTSQDVYASDYAWYSYVLDQATLLETEPTLETTAFVMTAEGVAITVEAKAGEVELKIGANARIPVTGTDALNDTTKPFEKKNVEIGTKTQNDDGTLTIKVQPNHEIWEDKPAQFFFKSALQ